MTTVSLQAGLAGVAAVLSSLLAAMLFVAAPPAAAALASVGTNFSASGPYATTVTRAASTTVYHPATLPDGVLHPVVLWGNGTGASVSAYDGFLRHLASHGFIVAAANTGSAGSGSAMLAGIDVVAANPTLRASADLNRIGATGHSQGGGGALAAGRDARVDTTFPLQPFTSGASGLRGPALLFAGENDVLVPPRRVRSAYAEAAATVPAGYAELEGASHFTATGSVGGYRGAATAWARWQLADDALAAPLFTGASPGLSTSPEWSAYEANTALRSLGTGTPTTPPPAPEPTCRWWQWWCR